MDTSLLPVFVLSSAVSLEQQHLPYSPSRIHSSVKETFGESIHSVSTTNYTEFLSRSFQGIECYYLNGCLNEYYDPYWNKTISENDLKSAKSNKDIRISKDGHIVIPLLLTQSGTRPTLSSDFSSRVVEAIRAWKRSDNLFVVGYGFGETDYLLNQMIREFLENERHQLYVAQWDESEDRESIGRKLRYPSERINLLKIRKEENGGARIVFEGVV